MKTSRRHELQTNELADSLARWIEMVKPYSRAALAAVLAIVVIIFAWSYLSAQRSRKTAEGWTAIFDAANAADPREELADVAARYAGSPVGQWARVSLADLQLDQGTNRLLVDRAAARDELRQAAEAYRAVLIEAREPMLLQRATFGLARAHEALGTPTELESARTEYRSIAEKWPDSPYAKDAARRAADLDQAATKNFYDWLARYEPPRPVAGQPGTPGARPDFLKDPLEESGPELPSAVDTSALPKFGDAPAEGPALGDEPGAAPAPSDPAAGDAPPQPEAAASDAPQAAVPPDAPAPSGEQPAGGEPK
jgi:hypothetical protein